MLTTHTKLIIFKCLLLGLVLFILGCAGTNMMTPQTQRYPQDAKRSVDVIIDTSQRQQFFDQLRKFADKHEFTIRIDTRSFGPEYFLIYMTRSDLEISGENAFVPGEYGFGFYQADLLHPAAESVLDDLVNDLKSFIREVPSATFTVEKP